MRDLGLHKLSLFILDSAFLILFWARRRRVNGLRKRVLVIRLDAIGDFVLWIDAARALRKLYPSKDFEVTLLGNVMWTSLAEELGIFDTIWQLDRKYFIWNLPYRFKKLLTIRRACFDIVVHPNFSREFSYGDTVVRASGASVRIGYQGNTANRSFFTKHISDTWYTKLVFAEEGEMMELQRQAEFIRGLGCHKFKSSVPVLDVHYDCPEGFSHDKYYVVVPGTGSSYRQWPLQKFSKIAELVYELTGLTAVVCGAKSETFLGDSLADSQPGLFHNWVGRTSLCELVAIIDGAEFVLSGETSAVHIAAAVGVPSVCILGGGHFGRFLPYDVDNEKMGVNPLPVYVEMDCFKCNWECQFKVPQGQPVPCVERVEVDDVWRAIKKLFPLME